MHIGSTGRPKKHFFHELAFVRLSKSCFPLRAGSIFPKNRRMFCKKKGFEAGKAQRKEQIVYEINKIASMMHTLIFADGALGARNARHCGEKHNFKGGRERKKSEPNEPKGDKNEHT